MATRILVINMSITEQIHDTIELLKELPINGCISGSSMIPEADFDTWTSVPDVDVFVYSDMQLLFTSTMLISGYGFEPASAAEKQKLEWLRDDGCNRKATLTTVKVKHGDVIVNLTWKKWKTSLVDVLASFDQSCIMIGYDIPFAWGIDMRTSDVKVFDDKYSRWSNDPQVSVPNPMRKQKADRYTTAQWVRQFARVMKYWERGIDTRPMARFYIELIDDVIEKGSLFNTERDIAGYEEFVEMYAPLRDKMALWLEDKEKC